MAYKELTTYFSDDQKRRSTVLFNLETKQFHVTVISDSGTSFTSVYDKEEDADQFAEDWVL